MFLEFFGRNSKRFWSQSSVVDQIDWGDELGAFKWNIQADRLGKTYYVGVKHALTSTNSYISHQGGAWNGIFAFYGCTNLTHLQLDYLKNILLLFSSYTNMSYFLAKNTYFFLAPQTIFLVVKKFTNCFYIFSWGSKYFSCPFTFQRMFKIFQNSQDKWANSFAQKCSNMSEILSRKKCLFWSNAIVFLRFCFHLFCKNREMCTNTSLPSLRVYFAFKNAKLFLLMWRR